MKIVYLTAGAADMYCGTCLHDNTLATTLIADGHDVLLTPLYTPTRTDERNVSGSHVFFSGINVYLQQKSWFFRHTPRLIDKLFESPWLLNKLAGRASATAPEQLGDLTVSMLRGEEGRQRKELAKLIEWLAHEKPQVVHLSNSLLLGAAREIRRALAVPIVCSVSGEDLFLAHIGEPYFSQARDTLGDRSRDVNVFVAMNQFYADYMADYLNVEVERFKVIRHGLNVQKYQRDDSSKEAGATIGHLARICPDKGLHLLMEAAKELAEQRRTESFRVRAAGYLGKQDRSYLNDIARLAAQEPVVDFEYVGEMDLPSKVEFLSCIDVMALPAVHGESKGISAIESLAVGTPIIVPDHGVFPELIADTAGGTLFEQGNVTALAKVLADHLDNPERSREQGRQGQAAIHDRYTAERMARETMDLYERELASAGRSS